MKNRSFRTNRRRIFCLNLLGLPFLCWTVLAQRPPVQIPQFPVPPRGQQQNEKPAVLKMRVEAGRVTAEILDCPLQNALKELADRTGIIFEVRSQDNPLVSVNLDRVPLQEAVQRIASGSDTMFFYAEGVPGSEKISMVRIFPQGNEPVQPGIVYLGTGAVTKTGDGTDSPEQALKVLEESASVEEREKAIETLAAVKNDASIEALAKAVSDPAPEIRVAAIEALAALQARAALPAVLRGLKDTHPGVRQSAANAVGVLGSAKDLRQLKPLTADKDAGVAAAAELAVRKLLAAPNQ
jgi:hypothetical protein